MSILHIVPVLGRRSETFILERLDFSINNFNTKILSTNIFEENLISKKIVKRSSVIDGRYSENPLIKAKFILKDRVFGGYNSISVSRLIEEILKFEPEVIHVHFGYMASSLLNVLDVLNEKGMFLPKKIIINFHGSDVLSFPNRYRQQSKCCVQLFEKYNAIFVCPTAFLKKKAEFILGLPSECIVAIGNTVAPSLITSFYNEFINRSISANSSKLKFINISRLTKWKGHVYLIKAFSQFVENTSNEHALEIIGDGEERTSLEALISELGMENNIKLLGSLPHSSVVSCLKSSDIYIHSAIVDKNTNQQESFGVAILEGLVSGLPCITTNTGGIPDLLGSRKTNSVKIVSEESIDSIYSALCSVVEFGMCNDKDYVEHLLKKFSPDVINKKWHSIYTK